jgi:hypothetical protein
MMARRAPFGRFGAPALRGRQALNARPVGPTRPVGGPPPLWAALDKNRDATLSADEISAAPEALKKLDTDGDGQVTPREILQSLVNRRPGGNAHEADRPGRGDRPEAARDGNRPGPGRGDRPEAARSDRPARGPRPDRDPFRPGDRGPRRPGGEPDERPSPKPEV